MANLVIGQDYYFLSESDYSSFCSGLAAAGFDPSDFSVFQVDQAGYAGYYFEMSSIDQDGEWEYLAGFDSFDTRTVWQSVQANYLG